jgi:hypothetical protein
LAAIIDASCSEVLEIYSRFMSIALLLYLAIAYTIPTTYEEIMRVKYIDESTNP